MDDRGYDLAGIRQDWRYQATERHFVKFGFDAKWLDAEYRYRRKTDRAPLDIELEGIPPDGITAAAPEHVDRDLALDLSGTSLGVWVADRIRLAEPLTLEAGLRFDRQTYADDEQVSPRVALAYMPTPRTTVRASWGRFHQSQRINELQIEDGVETFAEAQRAEHWLAGVDQRFAGNIDLRLEVFLKRMTDIRPRFENVFDMVEVVPEANSDRIRIAPDAAEARGVEVLIRRDTGGAVAWWVNYAMSKVEDEFGDVRIRRQWDQRHTVNYSVNFRAGSAWNLNVSGALRSGWPTTTLSARSEIAEDGTVTVIPVLGDYNGSSYPAYHRVDLRASRTFAVGRGKLAFYFEMFNVLGRSNPCCVDHHLFQVEPGGDVLVTRQQDDWLPRLPSFGLTWTF